MYASGFSGAVSPDLETFRTLAKDRRVIPVVRRLLADVGFPVQTLVRTDIGTVVLGDQRPGSIRALTRKEVGELYKAVGM